MAFATELRRTWYVEFAYIVDVVCGRTAAVLQRVFAARWASIAALVCFPFPCFERDLLSCQLPIVWPVQRTCASAACAQQTETTHPGHCALPRAEAVHLRDRAPIRPQLSTAPIALCSGRHRWRAIHKPVQVRVNNNASLK